MRTVKHPDTAVISDYDLQLVLKEYIETGTDRKVVGDVVISVAYVQQLGREREEEYTATAKLEDVK